VVLVGKGVKVVDGRAVGRARGIVAVGMG